MMMKRATNHLTTLWRTWHYTFDTVTGFLNQSHALLGSDEKASQLMVDSTTETPTYLESHNESPHRPNGPKGGLWSLKYIDKIKAARMVASKKRRDLYTNFPTLLEPGDMFPEIELTTTTGDRVNTRDYVGKQHLVLMTGAIT